MTAAVGAWIQAPSIGTRMIGADDSGIDANIGSTS
jgi:hypothetical protein